MSSWSTFSSQVKRKEPSSRPGDQSIPELPLRSKGGTRQLGTSSSFLGLKADISERKGYSGEGGSRSDAVSKGNKKLPAFLRPSPDVVARSLKNDRRQTTSSWANTPSSQLDAARQALEKKVAMYEKLKSGATGGLDEQSFKDSLIDWDRKGYEKDDADSDVSSEEEDEASDDDRAGDSEEDPMTEYEDDLGRMRKVRRSRVPRSALHARQEKQEGINEDMSIYGPSTSFPVFKREFKEEEEKGYKRKGVTHFDAQFEKRHRGAGFYQFSQDEEVRRKEMEALKLERDETERERANRGGDQGDQDGLSIGERRREKRRKVVQKKMREIEAKRSRLAAAHDKAREGA
ncbi:hypothetical protein CBS101457_003206 [Exobasidium rhododendri]|nr:hypothetical protein CBS101457_003206 [Exobasidium rhododendri]